MYTCVRQRQEVGVHKVTGWRLDGSGSIPTRCEKFAPSGWPDWLWGKQPT